MDCFDAAAGVSGDIEGGQELEHGPEPVARHLGQRPLHRPSHRARHPRPKRGDRRHRVEDLPRHHGAGSGPGEGRLTREQLVEHAREPVLVRPPVHLAAALDLFGAHVGRSPQADAGLRQLVAGLGSDGARDAEVGDQCMALREQDVLGLHVAMDQALAVGVVERVADLPHQTERLRHGKGPLTRESLAQRLALHVRHDIEGPGRRLLGGAGVEQGQDVGVLKPRQDLDLEQEALRAPADEDLGAQDLDGDRAVVLAVAREVHDRHAAPAQHAFDGVAVA